MAATSRPFDWNRDCGDMVSPQDAVDLARVSGETFREFALSYAFAWPHDTPQPDDLVDGMVREMDKAASGTCDVCGDEATTRGLDDGDFAGRPLCADCASAGV